MRYEKKTKAARENASHPRPNRKPKPLAELECICGLDAPTDSGDSVTLEGHKASCPRGRAIRRRTSPANAPQPAK